MPPARFEHTIPAGEQPQANALDRAATGAVCLLLQVYVMIYHLGLGWKWYQVFVKHLLLLLLPLLLVPLLILDSITTNLTSNTFHITTHCDPCNKQIDAHFFKYVYFYSLHISGSHVPIIRRIIVSMRQLIYVTLCRWPSGMQVNLHTRPVHHNLHTRPSGMQVNLHKRRSSTQSDIYQILHWYNNSPDDGHMAARNM